jgi:chromosome segregation ATPase
LGAMGQREADLSLVLQIVNTQESESYPKSARTMLAEGLPFALPAPPTADAAAHAFQAKFINYVEQLVAEAKTQAVKDGAAAEAKVDEAAEDLAKRRTEGDTAKSALEEAVSQVEAAKKQIKELEEAVVLAEAEHQNRQAEGASQKEEWAELRKSLEEAASVEDGALMLLDQDEGDQETRSAAAEHVGSYIQGQKAEKVLHAAATLALTVKPCDRGGFDRMTAKAVSDLVKKRVAELKEKLAGVEPEEQHLLAEICGLWAIADCARDALASAKDELVKADTALCESRLSSKAAEQMLHEAEALLKEQESSKAAAAGREQQVVDAIAALERLSKLDVDNAGDAAEPEAKRARVEEASA